MSSMLRPMSTAEILDRTFNLYRNNFVLFAGIALLPALIAAILHVVGITAQLTVRTLGRTLAQTQLMSVAYDLLVLFISSIIGGAIATGATVCAIYHFDLGRPATIVGSYKNALAAWFRVICAAVLAFLLIFAVCVVLSIALLTAVVLPLSRTGNDRLSPAFAAFVVLGIAALIFVCWVYISGWLSFVVPAVVLDKNTVFRAFRRSHRLSKGSRGRIFLVLLLTFLLTLAFTWTLRFPAYVIFNRFRQEIQFQAWSYAAEFLSTVMAGPIATIAIALFYIDQRVRKEAFDLHVMMQAIQENDSAPVPIAKSAAT